MSDEDSSLIQTSDKRQMLWIGSKTMPIEENETEDTAGDMTQNTNHYLTDADTLWHWRETEWEFFLQEPEFGIRGQWDSSIMVIFLPSSDKGSQRTHSYS